MTPRHVAGRALRLLVSVVLAVSGLYLLIYLYRWEWNRAIISGLFFVASEVALATAMLSQRIRALEHREPSAAEPPSSTPSPLERLRATPVDRPDPFGWLKPESGRMGVFVPVLLGAGVILSAVAFVVERIAEATAVPVLDRRLASRLSALSPRPGGLHGGATAQQARSSQPPRGQLLRTALAVVAVTLLGWLGIDALRDATESRPDPGARPEVTTVDFTITARGGVVPAGTAEALWINCRAAIGSQSVTPEVVVLDDDQARLVLTPGIGELKVRRLTGCLNDLNIDRVVARVTGVESTP